jgi:hypothetical protein
VDNVYGDRNLFCSCIPMEDYAEMSAEDAGAPAPAGVAAPA